MEKVYYDLHIHSCLSPCGDLDMTPNNIVNMALLKGLDVIAVTDHNSCANCKAVKAAAEWAAESGAWKRKRLMVLFGAEVETEEEVHVLCLFASEEEGRCFYEALAPYLTDMKNRTDIYGQQLLMDERDAVTGAEDRLLAFAAAISFEELFRLTGKMGGAFVPAHIDKPVYSVLSNMGFIPAELPIRTVEVSPRGIENGFLLENPEISVNYQVITSSDAHYLEDMAEASDYLEISERTEEAVIHRLKFGETRK